MSEQDFYQVLELSYDASADDVRSAYERLRRLFETGAVAAYTLFGEDESSQVRERLDQAFAVLSDDERREEYDAEIGNEQDGRISERKTAASDSRSTTESEPSLSHTASFDAHSEMTVSVIQPATAPVATETAPVEVEAAPAREVTAAEPETPAPLPAAPETAPAPSVATADSKPIDSGDKAGLADNHEDGQYSGGVLQRLRENKSLTIADIAKKTKISLAHLRAIEGNAYDKLPARVYVRGFVGQYARCLGLHPERTADSYLQIYDRYFQSKT